MKKIFPILIALLLWSCSYLAYNDNTLGETTGKDTQTEDSIAASL